MSVRSAASYLWGSVIGMAILAVLGFPVSVILTIVFTWACIFIIGVLYDEWRHPANAYTGWNTR